MLLPQLLTLCAAALPLAAATSPSAIHNLPAGWDNIARRAVPSPSRLTKRHGVGHVYPLPDGFPAPTSKQLQAIQDQALGALPGGALPTKLDKDSITSFQLVAFNELFEVAFFNSLLYNVTHNVKGYTDLRGETKAYVVETLKAVVAQEQLHALAANAVLKNVKAQTIEPSKEYFYGVESFDQAIALVSVSKLALRAVTGVLIVPLCFLGRHLHYGRLGNAPGHRWPLCPQCSRPRPSRCFGHWTGRRAARILPPHPQEVLPQLATLWHLLDPRVCLHTLEDLPSRSEDRKSVV